MTFRLHLIDYATPAAQILFHSQTSGSYDLYTMASDGSGVAPLTQTPDVQEINPSWWGPATAEPHTPDCGEAPQPED